ncbi:hypothetical protein ABZ746_02425 [Streptomyces sp. NPDC020096]
MSSDRKRPLAALVAALAFVLLSVLPAAAAEPSPGQRIADALRTSPVYVDGAYASAVPAQRQQQLVAQIRRTGLPIKVALVPLVKGDAFDGDPDVLADIVHERLGQGELVLITMDKWTDALDGHEWPDDKHQARDAVAAVGFLDSMKDAGLADRVSKAIELIAQGDGTKVYQNATASLGKDSSTPQKPAAKGGGASWLPTGVVIAALVLCASGPFWLVRHRRRRSPDAPFAFPQAVFAAARTASEDELRHHAEAEVLALGEAVQAADPSDDATAPGLRRALDAYAAAGTVLDGARGLPDLAGVLALVAVGRDALDGQSSALPLCFFNPLHGRAERRLSWRPLGRRDHLEVAACRDCGQAVRARRAPEVLTDTRADGRQVPYFELPSDDSVWAATGYGSLVEAGDTDGMAARVLRGDFSRARRH